MKPGNRGTNRAQTERFDPYMILSALERNRVSYVVIGGFARVVQGTGEVTHGPDITPSLRQISPGSIALWRNSTRGPPTASRRASPASSPPSQRCAPVAGRHHYADARRDARLHEHHRHATHEAIGRGLRAQIASAGDLARMLGALDRPGDQDKLLRLRRMVELGRELDFGLEL